MLDSGQEASHGPIKAVKKEAEGSLTPLQDVLAKEGEYGSFAYGTGYVVDPDGTPSNTYTTPQGETFKFDLEQYGKFIETIKKPKNGVIPSKFKVTEAGENGPWLQDPKVN